MKECDSEENLNVGFDRINSGYVNTLGVLNADVYENAEHQKNNDHIITKDVCTSTDNSVVTKEEAGIKIITKTNGAKEPIATKIVAGCCEKFDHNKKTDLNAKQGKESKGTHPNRKDENGDMLEVPNYNLQTRKEGKKCIIF